MTKQVDTNRLLLSPITESDKEFVFSLNECEAVMASLPDIPYSSEELRQKDDWLDISEGKIVAGAWIMEEKSSNKPIGTIIFCQMPLTDTAIEPVEYTNNVEIGYRCFPEFWGKGYTTEAGKAVIRYIFENDILSTITACTDEDNFASKAVLKKIGLQPAGNLNCYGGFHPFFQLNKEDWLASEADIS